MLTAILFSVLLSPARASEPPKYEADAELKSLGSYAEADIADVNKLLSTPMEKAQAPALKAGIDDIGRQADGASASAQALDAAAQPPILEMTADIKGKGIRESFESRIEAASTAAPRKRWAKDSERARTLQNEPAPPGETPEEKAKRKDAIKAVLDLLAQADAALLDVETRLKAMDESRASARQENGRAATAEGELAAAVTRLGKGAGLIRDSSAEAKAAIDLLGTEPENETYTRANQKLAPVLDGGRAVYHEADVVKHRAQDFSARYAAYLKHAARFESERKAALQRLSDADGLLSSAEDALGRLSRT